MPTRQQLADALRVLAIDAIEQAKSGHPGAPMGMADMAEALWRHTYKHSPTHPDWFDRDRFILSNGHASMLLYGLLHLSGYALSIEDIKNFRQLGTNTPGHPEYGPTPGVDCTTGPLGQGIASAVGMALAERSLAHAFNQDDLAIIDHYTYCFCGDGCMMEGVTAEACSLAGTWQLGKLIVLYDANSISIDGEIKDWFTEDVKARFEAYQWQVIGPIDGHDCVKLDLAIQKAQAEKTKPSLIICQTHIGLGSPQVDTAKCHGAPLGAESIAVCRQAYGWQHPPFHVPDDIYAAWDAKARGEELYASWQEKFKQYQAKYPKLALELERRMRGDLPDNFAKTFTDLVASVEQEQKNVATRKASQKCLEAFTAIMPELMGGSADLSGSVGTMTSHTTPFDSQTAAGNYLYYGVREFGMACIANGLALHGGFMPYSGTFLAFSDQAKNALRLAALMQAKTAWVFTHDSIGVGEDGPTHQPVEQILALRTIPGMSVWRPCDSYETAFAWKFALEHHGPTTLILSRQTLPYIERDAEVKANVARGGYILRRGAPKPDLLLIATGSEVSLALKAWEELASKGYKVNLVSMPAPEIFATQPKAYQDEVLPLDVRKRLAIEAASSNYWWKYVGLDGQVLGLDSFGVSAKANEVFAHFGFTVEHIVELALDLLGQK